jgi:hypothetical protein
MRAWHVMPNAVLFDNGSPCKGNLMTTFYGKWLLDHWRHDLHSYVHYRNYLRGQKA